MILTQLVQTCSACPSQWEGRLDDGRYVYARFRYGFLYVGAAPTMDAAVWPDDEDTTEVLFAEQISDGLDGILSESEMLRLAGLTRKEDA